MRAGASIVQLFSDDDNESIDPRTFLDDDRLWEGGSGSGGSGGGEAAAKLASSSSSTAGGDFEDFDEGRTTGPFSWEQAEIAPELRQAVADSLSFKEMTRIQKLAMGPILNGRDVVGTAETGSGKTLAFLLPICHGILLHNPELRGGGGGAAAAEGAFLGSNFALPPAAAGGGGGIGVRCLILSPTREIAIQTDSVAKKICRYTRIRSTVVCGGVKQSHQEVCIRSGVTIVCACPGRLLDLLRRGLDSEFHRLEYLVFDEADRILDLGFLPDIQDLLSLLPAGGGGATTGWSSPWSWSMEGGGGGAAAQPPRRQTLLFSATMPSDVMNIAQTYLNKPIIRIGLFENEIQQVFTIHENVWNVPSTLKADFLLPLIQYRERLGGDTAPAEVGGKGEERKQTLIFARTKARANRVCELLTSAGIRADRIHGNRSQSARVKALSDFKNGEIRVLVATDVAARGIDLKTLDVVINFDIPATPEEYVHRAGRVGRAGAHGRCWTLVSEDEVEQLRSIEQWIGRRLPVHAPLPGFDYESTTPVHIITKSGHNEEQVPPPPPSRHIRQTSLPALPRNSSGGGGGHHHRVGGVGNNNNNNNNYNNGGNRPHQHRRQRSAGPQMSGNHPRQPPAAPQLLYHQTPQHIIAAVPVASPSRGPLPHRFGIHADRINRRPPATAALQQQAASQYQLNKSPSLTNYNGLYSTAAGSVPKPQYHQHRRAFSSESGGPSLKSNTGGSPLQLHAAITQASMVWKSRLQGPQAPVQKDPGSLFNTSPNGYHLPPPPPRERYMLGGPVVPPPLKLSDDLRGERLSSLWASFPRAAGFVDEGCQ